MADDIIFHKLNLPHAHHPLDSILEILAIVQLKWPQTPTMIFTFFVWNIPPKERWLHEIFWSWGNKPRI